MNLVQRAKEVIINNWRNGFSIPTDKLYPFQWNWDSGFVAMGTANFDLDKSLIEINSMFSGQWENGMLPHILFHSENETSYFPNFDFWNSNVNDGAPIKPKSSGITQPPVFGFVLEAILNQFPNNNKVIDFIKSIYPKILKYHNFLYTYRDPYKEGLFFIFHPWESGRDNSPIWDASLDRILIKENEIPKYIRRDTSIADATERPTQQQYDRYVYLLELGKKYAYDGPEIFEESPFLIQDAMMNAILIKSNESLIKIGEIFGFDNSQLKVWQALSKANYSKKFWNEELEFFVSYDQREDQQIFHKEIGGIIALFGNVATKEQAKKIVAFLSGIHERGYYLCPSFDIDSPLFDSKRYWRGPIWPQMNWMIYHGLKNYGYDQLADVVKSDLIHLVRELGFSEYFESNKETASKLEKGYGGNNFSWTASTIISFFNQDV
jgi:hypothetical protein